MARLGVKARSNGFTVVLGSVVAGRPGATGASMRATKAKLGEGVEVERLENL